MRQVRKVTRDDVPGLSESLTRAFWDDPVTSWFYPDEARRGDQLRKSFELRLKAVFMSRGENWTVDGLRAGALWAPPGTWQVGTRELIRMVPLLFDFGRRVGEVMRGLSKLDELHPREPHWYLAVLGTEPEHQGEGHGSALLAKVLERVDREEAPAYLESSKADNLPFYGRHGFEVTGELVLPDGPKLWTMWREPREVTLGVGGTG